MEQRTSTRMPQAQVTRIPFVIANVDRCLCPKCQVQGDSVCVTEKMALIGGDVRGTLPTPEEMPGEYCSSGTATCQDIDASRVCSCFGCPVYSDYKLADGQPTCYYCRDGSAR